MPLTDGIKMEVVKWIIVSECVVVYYSATMARLLEDFYFINSSGYRILRFPEWVFPRIAALSIHIQIHFIYY